MESKYDLIVFDLDGTLIDTLDDISSALNKAIEPFGVGPHTTETVRSFVGDGTWQLVERALEDKAAQHIDEATKNFKEIYSQNLVHMTQPYERIFDLLRFVQYPMAVATNKPEAMAKTILDKLGMAGFFLGLVGGDTLP
ncbi:HAD hydrolase-like protein, partial [Myxococcota bacterium]|nr:HAD hydrolase-like protein [Myxococcota bacterium]